MRGELVSASSLLTPHDFEGYKDDSEKCQFPRLAWIGRYPPWPGEVEGQAISFRVPVEGQAELLEYYPSVMAGDSINGTSLGRTCSEARSRSA